MVKQSARSQLLKKILSPHTVKARSHLAKMIKGQKSTVGKSFSSIFSHEPDIAAMYQHYARQAFGEHTRKTIQHQLAVAAAMDAGYRRALAAATGGVGALGVLGAGIMMRKKRKPSGD